MADLSYGVGAYLRSEGNLPELKLVNMWVEQTPAAEKGVILQSRPGLLSSVSRGLGPVQGLFQKDGVFGGDVFTLSGGSLYRGAALVGSVPGSGPVSFAASQAELVVTAGGKAYSYNGSNLAAIAFPDSAHVTAVAFLAGYFIYLRADTHRFYWSAVLDGRTIDALDYASAESAPDLLLDALTVQDELWLVGSDTIEPWQPTGDPETPFIRSQGRLYRKGAVSTGCAREVDNSLFWIGNDRLAYRAADVPQRISDHGIEERIAGSSAVSTFKFLYRGHSFFCVRLDAGTFAYDAATGQWCELASYGYDNFLAGCAIDIDGNPLFGSAEGGALYIFGAHAEAGGPHLRGFTAATPLSGVAVLRNLLLTVNVGHTGSLSGNYSEPVVEMRTSRDAGQTWSTWRTALLGAQGRYRTRTIWRRLGMFADPGVVIEFRCTDPVPFRVSEVKVNVPLGGRSR